VTIFGPRASILRIGVAEPLDDERWYVTGWTMRCLHSPCPETVSYDDEGKPLALFGWSLEDLRAMSAAEFELADLPITEGTQ
jgi:hypothetical protein